MHRRFGRASKPTGDSAGASASGAPPSHREAAASGARGYLGGWYAIAAALGLVIGLGSFTFYQAKGFSYLLDDPLACVNCHVMQEQYDAWQHSSHRFVAGCNDCHTPKGFVPKWASKALNGFNHSVAFTRGGFHEPIMAKAFNQQIAMGRCVDCHAAAVSDMGVHPTELDAVSCVRCHGNVGHRTRE